MHVLQAGWGLRRSGWKAPLHGVGSCRLRRPIRLLSIPRHFLKPISTPPALCGQLPDRWIARRNPEPVQQPFSAIFTIQHEPRALHEKPGRRGQHQRARPAPSCANEPRGSLGKPAPAAAENCTASAGSDGAGGGLGHRRRQVSAASHRCRPSKRAACLPAGPLPSAFSSWLQHRTSAPEELLAARSHL